MTLKCGAAYYPELWPAKVIEEDICYMKDVGINVIRMGEFAWSKLEPRIDEIDVSFFVEIVHRLHNEGISVIFCTPTATPPIWMSHEHPERMHVNEQGMVMSHGARQHVCTNNPFYRERSAIITEAVAKSISRLPGVIGWQIHNELKNEVTECMCASCKEQWHAWLEARYRDIDNLNDAWGTEIWSERYQRFDQVPQPVATTFLHNASLSTAYRAFSREKAAEFVAEQAIIIRKYSDAPITHNTNRLFALDNELIYMHLSLWFCLIGC